MDSSSAKGLRITILGNKHSQLISGHWFLTITLENIGKPLVFWFFDRHRKTPVAWNGWSVSFSEAVPIRFENGFGNVSASNWKHLLMRALKKELAL